MLTTAQFAQIKARSDNGTTPAPADVPMLLADVERLKEENRQQRGLIELLKAQLAEGRNNDE